MNGIDLGFLVGFLDVHANLVDIAQTLIFYCTQLRVVIQRGLGSSNIDFGNKQANEIAFLTNQG